MLLIQKVIEFGYLDETFNIRRIKVKACTSTKVQEVHFEL